MAGVTNYVGKKVKKIVKGGKNVGKGGAKSYDTMTKAERKAFRDAEKADEAAALAKLESAEKYLAESTGDDLAFDEAQAYGDALRAKKGVSKKSDKTGPEDSGDISEVVPRKDRKPSPSKKQTSKERLINATGAISAMLTKAGPKPLSMDKYRSLPTRFRNAFGRQASSDYDRGIITKSEYETIIERIEFAELKKNVVALQQGIADKKAKKVTIDNSMAPAKTKGPKKSTDMSKSELAEKLREQEAAAKPKLSKGGMTKKKAYSRGGLTTGAKSRTGHTDMRKGGLFK